MDNEIELTQKDIKKEQLAELDMLFKRSKSLLRPIDVVNFARNEKTALHSKFEWDDTEAAEKYRLCQARQILRVAVTMIPTPYSNGDMNRVRACVSLKADRYNGGGYRPIANILSSKDLRTKMLNDALDELKTFQEKYEKLSELCEVMKAIKHTFNKVEEERKQLERKQSLVKEVKAAKKKTKEKRPSK